MNTKEKILEAALKLFNETNTQAATTNHIAKEAGISPGNLHYHFKNREEIIRILYMRMRDALIIDPHQHHLTIVELNEHYGLIFEQMWKYRFLQRELLFLLSRDSELKEIYVQETVAHRKRIILHLKGLVSDGMLDIPYDNIHEQIADSIMLVFQFWNAYTETLGKVVDQESISLGVSRLQEILRPHLTAQALKLLAEA